MARQKVMVVVMQIMFLQLSSCIVNSNNHSKTQSPR